MLQLLYISSASPSADLDLEKLLAQCRRNNERDEITGMLFTDGKRFLQALEGQKTVVEDAFLRIIADDRHRGLVLLSRREISRREFGDWSMAVRDKLEEHDDFAKRAAELCRAADPSVRATFEGLIDLRRSLTPDA